MTERRMSKGKLTPMPFGKARLRPAEERTSNPAGITAPGQYPTVRMRRNRQDGSVRRLVAENHLGVEDLIWRSEEHTSELQSLMRISYAVFCLKKKKKMREKSN